MMRMIRWTGAAALALFVAAPAFAEDKVAMKLVKYDDLIKIVHDSKGKVVVVDFWQNSCVACKKEFPNLLKLQEKYGKDLVAVSVNLDDPKDAKEREKAEKFLQSKKATNVTNLMLDEPEAVWTKKLNITSFPTIFVFDQEGETKVRYPEKKEKFDYTDVGKDVAELMKKK